MSDPIVGIDLGTSNSVVAYADATGNVQVLPDEGGYKIHPSVVSFHPNGGVIVGAAAKQRKVIDPKNTIYSVKRLIGRSYASKEVQTAKQRSPFEIKEGANQQPIIVTRGGEFAVPEVSAIVLDHVRGVAARQLQTAVGRAVVTVPASFNDAQRSATATAGAISGLKIVRVLNEPTAAALAYGHTRNLREIIAVYDFGGGTFDITILKLEDQVYEVLGTSGDTFLGGDDLDERLVDRMVDKFLVEHRIDLRTNEVSMMRLRAVAEQTKIELSRRSRAVVRVDEIAYGPKGKPLDLHIEITRDEFVRQIADIVDRSFPVCQESLSLAGLAITGIDDVVLVGGTTKIPYVRDQVTKFFGKAPRTDVNPEDAVAAGAALQAVALERVLSRKSPSRAPTTTTEQTLEHAPLDQTDQTDQTDTSLTMVAEELPLQEVTDDFELLDGEPAPGAARKRQTAGYSQLAKLPADRRVERGKQIDRFEERAPPPASARPIGRLTKEPRRTQLGVPTLDNPAPQASPARRPVPPAPPQARTLMIEPSSDGAARVDVRPTGRDLGSDEISSAASTAKGFAPPQSYPVLAATTNPVVIDVTPRGLGIGTVAGYCEGLIERNSRVPAEIRKVFTTSRDRQDSVRIIVCQGESRRLVDNVVIGDLRLENLAPLPRGETSIEVTFMLDASGILQICARDAQTGNEQRATLDIVGSMPAADIAASRDRLQAMRR